MYRLILGITIVMLFSACRPSAVITKEAAQVAFHTQFSQLLEGCERLGAIKVVYKSQHELSDLDNQSQAEVNMRQMAYDNYRADNVVFINSQKVGGEYGSPFTIYAQGVAFKCD